MPRHLNRGSDRSTALSPYLDEIKDDPLLTAAEQKTNPRLMETIGNLDLVPQDRWSLERGPAT